MRVSTQSISLEKEGNSGTSLVVQGLKMPPPKAEGPGLILVRDWTRAAARVHMPRLRAGLLQQAKIPPAALEIEALHVVFKTWHGQINNYF